MDNKRFYYFRSDRKRVSFAGGNKTTSDRIRDLPSSSHGQNPDLASYPCLPWLLRTRSSSVSRNASSDNSPSEISTILASQDEERQRIRHVLSEVPEPRSLILSIGPSTEFTGLTLDSGLSSLDRSQFLDTIADSGSHGISEPFFSTFSLPESSPPLQASTPLFPRPPPPDIPPLNPSYAPDRKHLAVVLPGAGLGATLRDSSHSGTIPVVGTSPPTAPFARFAGT
ncbi:hypothetical protein HOY82DRAFT_538062 [Tuber indicum]|nr:hypothetical protein HOY82DRAFT_538062 [Tuber indicum]